MCFKDVELAKAEGKINPITGQHIELTVQSAQNYELDKVQLKEFLNKILLNHMMPEPIKVSTILVGHRFKRRA